MLEENKNLKFLKNKLDDVQFNLINGPTPNLKELEEENLKYKTTPGNKDFLKRKKQRLEKPKEKMLQDEKMIETYREIENMKVTQTELAKLVLGMIPFINKIEQKWLGTPEEEEKKEVNEQTKENENLENLKNTNVIYDEKNLNDENAPNLNFKNNYFLENTVKDVDTEKNNYNNFDTKNSNVKKKIIKLKKIKNNKMQNMDIDKDKIELFNSWNLIDIRDLNQSAAIVANQFKEKGKEFYNETFNPEIIKNNCDIFTKEVVSEMTFKAKKEIEEKMQENINETIGKISEFKEEKIKEIKEDKNFIINIINELKLEPIINEMKKTKEEMLNIKEKMKKEIEDNNGIQKELINELKSIYNNDKEEIKRLREDILVELKKKDDEIKNLYEIINSKSIEISDIKNNIAELYNRNNIINNNINEIIKNIKELNENGDNSARYNIGIINNNIIDINRNIMNIIEQLKIKVDKNDNEKINKLIEENRKISLEKNIEERFMTLKNEIKEVKNIKVNEIFELFKKTKEQEDTQKIRLENREKEINNKWESLSKEILIKLKNVEEENKEKFKILNDTINEKKFITEKIFEKKENNYNNDYKNQISKLEIQLNRINDNIERNKEKINLLEVKYLNQENIITMFKKNQNYEKKIEINPKIESKINIPTEKERNNNNKYYSELNELEDKIREKTKKINLEMEDNIEKIKREIKRTKEEIEEEYMNKLNKNKIDIEKKLEDLDNERLKGKKVVDNEINEIKIKINNLKVWKDEIIKGKETEKEIEKIREKEIENIKIDMKKLEMIVSVPKGTKEEKKVLEKLEVKESENENIKKDINEIKKEIENLKNKEEKEKIKTEKINIKEKNEQYCTEKDCIYCRNIEKNLNEQIEVLGKVVESIETMAKQVKVIENNMSEIEGKKILEQENINEKEKEKEEEENKMKKQNEEKISNILDRLNKIEQDKFKKMDKEDKINEKFNVEVRNLKILDEIYNKGKNLNIYEVKNINELNKKLIKENYRKNNVYRAYETKKIGELMIKFFNNIGNLTETQMKEYEIKKEGIIQKRKKLIGTRKYQDIYIRRNKNKKSKNKIVRINEIKKKVIWEIELDDKERDYELIKNEQGDICIYDTKNNETVKKYCGLCLNNNHEKNKCIHITNYVNNLNNNWNNEEIKENVCNICGCMHKMTSLNCVAKLNCEYINKILEIVYYIINDNKLSFENEVLIKKKEKNYETYINKILDILNNNYEKIINKIEDNREEDNIWFNNISNINKFINDGYKEWNYTDRINNIYSTKSLGIVTKKKDIKAVMINFLKSKEYMKFNFKFDKNEIIYSNRPKKISLKITDKDLEKMYWNILNINLVKKINEVIKKEKNKEINIYTNENNNLFKKMFNKRFVSNRLKYKALDNMTIKKEIINQLTKIKESKNKEKYRGKITREIRLLENKKIKEIKKEKIIEYEIAKDWSESEEEVELQEEENKIIFNIDNKNIKKELENKNEKTQKIEIQKKEKITEEINNKEIIFNNIKKKLTNSIDILSNKSEKKNSISLTEKIVENYIENKSTKTKEDLIKKEATLNNEESEIDKQVLEDINKYIEEQENKDNEIDENKKENENINNIEESQDIDTRPKEKK